VSIVQTVPVVRIDAHNGKPVTFSIARLGAYKTTAM
jgi:hypothetical protein